MHAYIRTDVCLSFEGPTFIDLHYFNPLDCFTIIAQDDTIRTDSCPVEISITRVQPIQTTFEVYLSPATLFIEVLEDDSMTLYISLMHI